MEAMRTHPEDVSVQVAGCLALAFDVSGLGLKAEIVAAGGVEVAMEAMRKHPGEVAVQGNGCRALAALATNIEEGRAKIVAGGGVEVVMDAMRMHPKDASVQNLGSKVVVVGEATGPDAPPSHEALLRRLGIAPHASG